VGRERITRSCYYPRQSTSIQAKRITRFAAKSLIIWRRGRDSNIAQLLIYQGLRCRLAINLLLIRSVFHTRIIIPIQYTVPDKRVIVCFLQLRHRHSGAATLRISAVPLPDFTILSREQHVPHRRYSYGRCLRFFSDAKASAA